MLNRAHIGRYGVLQKSIVIPPHKLSALESGLKYYAESRISAKTVAEVSQMVYRIPWVFFLGGGEEGRQICRAGRQYKDGQDARVGMADRKHGIVSSSSIHFE
jgi:hypothetical protein